MKILRNLAAVTALAVGMSVSAFAATEAFDTIKINGETLENVIIVEYMDKDMIPLRAISEALDFEVIWNDETEKIDIVKMPVYITCSPYEDGYTFSKTAPVKLGSAPVMVNDRTYVPLNFIDEILQAEYSIADGALNISYGAEAVTPEISAAVIEKTENGFLVNDFDRGEIQVNITEETIIKNFEGKEIKADELDISKQLIIKLSDAMTASLPPQAAALEITETDENANIILSGEITEIVKDGDKVVQLILGDNELALNVDEFVRIDNFASEDEIKIEDLKEGMTVKAQGNGMATRSLPPQYVVTRIAVI